jgi:glycosyltransferase involved in cell wall biosynthesis
MTSRTPQNLRIALVLVNQAIGGTEKRFANIFSYLRRKGRHRYSLFINPRLFHGLKRAGFLTESENINFLFEKNIFGLSNSPVIDVRLLGRPVRGLNIIRSLAQKAEAYLDRKKYSRLTFDAAHFAFAGVYQKAISCRRLVLECQATSIADTHWKNRNFREMVKKAHRVNIASERIREELERITGIKDDKKYVVGPCSFIDHSRFHVSEKEPAIVFCGRLEQIKNPLLFVEAVKKMKSMFSGRFKAYIIGSGYLEEKVKIMTAAYGLGDVIVLERLDDPSPILARALVFCSLQSFDNYHSQSLMEGMASGCAVVATDAGETYRLIDETTGFRVPYDAGHIAEKAVWLLRHPEQAGKMGMNAREKVMREQTIERYSEYLESLYEDAQLE